MESVYGDLAGKAVVDLGCGCGMLSVGAAMFAPSYVLGVDLDAEALAAAADNAAEFGLPVDFVRADLGFAAGDAVPLRPNSFDTAIMNPPFGTKNNAGIDMLFLRRAIAAATGAVYSLHKSSTREVPARSRDTHTAPWSNLCPLSLDGHSTSARRRRSWARQWRSSRSCGTTSTPCTSSTRRNRCTMALEMVVETSVVAAMRRAHTGFPCCRARVHVRVVGGHRGRLSALRLQQKAGCTSCWAPAGRRRRLLGAAK